MQTFRVYLRIFLKSGLSTCITFLIVFAMICTLINSNSGGSGSGEFQGEKPSVAVLDEDDSALSHALLAFYEKHIDRVELPDDANFDDVRDGLFTSFYSFAVVIPKGFEADFLAGGTGGITSYQQPSSSAAMAAQSLESYLYTAALYRDTIGFDANTVEDTLAIESDASVYGEDVSEEADLAYFVNYLVYPIAAVILFCVTLVMLVVNESEVRRRTLCAPVKPMRHSFQLFLGNLIIGVMTFVVLVGVLSINYPNLYDTFRWKLWLANVALFDLICLCMSFLFSSFCKKKTIVNAIANIVSLGMCFLGGVFVPQEAMDEGLLRVMVFNPAYWFVRLNNEIVELPDCSWDSVSSVGWMALVELAFAVAFLSLALALSKRRKA